MTGGAPGSEVQTALSAFDDKNPSLTVAKVYLGLREQGVNAELPVWRRGGHG